MTIFQPEDITEIDIEITLAEHPKNSEIGFLGVVPVPLINMKDFHKQWKFEEQRPFFHFKGFPLEELPLDELPFDLEDLPLDQLPFDFEFELQPDSLQENEA